MLDGSLMPRLLRHSTVREFSIFTRVVLRGVVASIFGRIIPALSFAGGEEHVEQSAGDVNSSRDEKHQPPLCLSWLRRERKRERDSE